MRVPVSVLIPTYNEELNLTGCLQSVQDWAGEVVVVDSFSSDRTIEIAESHGATVVRHAYEGPAVQKNWALDNLALRHEWILILDADERVSPELREEIAALLAGSPQCSGYYINRRFLFYGRWIRHCGWYPSWNLRLFRRGAGRYERREVHEHVVLDGAVGYCRHDLIHEDLRDLTSWIDKHNRYASAEARENLRTLERNRQESPPRLAFGGAVGLKRSIKNGLWIHLPAPVRSMVLFFYMYVFRLGFLDGIRGLHFCILHAVVEYFYAIKLWELRRYKSGAPQGGIVVRSVASGR